MSNIDEYRRAVDYCIFRANQSWSAEIREFWMSIRRSYQFLIDREKRQQALAEE